MLVAEGAVDVAAEPELSLWDVAALIPIVTEAGGRFTAIDGQPSGGTVRSALATNGLLHDQVLTRAERVTSSRSGRLRSASNVVESTRTGGLTAWPFGRSDHSTDNDEPFTLRRCDSFVARLQAL